MPSAREHAEYQSHGRRGGRRCRGVCLPQRNGFFHNPLFSEWQHLATDSELAACVTTTNQFRASVSLPALARSSAIEAYAATAAQADDASGVAHSYSSAHNGGVTSGIWAENETLRLDYAFVGGTVGAAIQASLTLFWSEGPGGGHYENIVGPFTQMGCGVYLDGPVITVFQDFR